MRERITIFFQLLYTRRLTIAKFLISGGLAAVVDLLVLHILTAWVGLWYLFSSIIAFFVAFGVSFSLQKFWTFRDSSINWLGGQMGLYLAVSFFNVSLNTILMLVFVSGSGLHYLLSQIIAGFIVAVGSFFLYRNFVFGEGVINGRKIFGFCANFFRRHSAAFILAFLIGAATVAPQFFAIKNMETAFEGIYPIYNNDEVYYMARAKEVIDGHGMQANPYLYEYKESQPVQFWLPDYIMAKPLALLGVSLNKGLMFYDFLLPAILAFLTYFAVFLLAGRRSWAILSVFFLNGFLFFSLFNRAPSPQFTFIFWLLLFIFLFLYVESEKKRWAVLSSITLGLLFNFYPYFWTFWLAFLAVFLGLWLFFSLYGGTEIWKLEKIDWKVYGLIILGALIIASPYFWSLWQSINLPYYSETLRRIGMLDSHFPSGFRIILLPAFMIVSAFYLAFRKGVLEKSAATLFIFSGLITSAIVVNQQIITGKDLELYSHYKLPAIFWFVFAVVFLIGRLFSKTRLRVFRTPITFAAAILVMIFSANTVTSTIMSQSEPKLYVYEWQRYAPVFDWLNANTAKDSVVFASSPLSFLVPIYTGNNVFYAPSVRLHFAPDSEIKARFILAHFWDKIDDSFARKEEKAIWGSQYADAYDINMIKNRFRKLFGFQEILYGRVPEESLRDFLSLASDIQKSDFKSEIRRYRVDYFIFDKKIDANWPISKLSFLKPVYEFSDFQIFSVEF